MQWLSDAEGYLVAIVCVVLVFVFMALAIRLGRKKGEKPLPFWQFTMRQAAVLIFVLAILFALLSAYYRLEIRPQS